MKYKYLLLLLLGSIVLGFTACNKDDSSGYPVTGKWQETKLALYGDSAGVRYYDTTYTQPFTSSDYVQFNTNGICDFVSDHNYYPNILNYPKIPQAIAVSTYEMKFSSLGNSAYLVFPVTETINFAGVVQADTVKVLNDHTMMMHAVAYSHDPSYYQAADSYYEKK